MRQFSYFFSFIDLISFLINCKYITDFYLKVHEDQSFWMIFASIMWSIFIIFHIASIFKILFFFEPKDCNWLGVRLTLIIISLIYPITVPIIVYVNDLSNLLVISLIMVFYTIVSFDILIDICKINEFGLCISWPLVIFLITSSLFIITVAIWLCVNGPLNPINLGIIIFCFEYPFFSCIFFSIR